MQTKTKTSKLPPLATPWGQAERTLVVADGIAIVSTSSHGGMHLSPERWQHLMSLFPRFKPFGSNGAGWLEEDCDFTLGVLAFPEFFTDSDIARAFAMAIGFKHRDGSPYYPDAQAYLLAPETGAALLARAQAFQATQTTEAA